MNVLNALINLRNDLKTWVSNNIKNVNSKFSNYLPLSGGTVKSVSNGTNYIAFPRQNTSVANPGTGYLKILLPGNWGGGYHYSMIMFTVSIYTYNGDNRCVNYVVGGHPWPSGESLTWYQTTAQCTNNVVNDLANLPVNFYYDTTANRAGIAIGTSSTGWSYCYPSIHDVTYGNTPNVTDADTFDIYIDASDPINVTKTHTTTNQIPSMSISGTTLTITQ